MTISYSMMQAAHDTRSPVIADGVWDSYGGENDTAWVSFGTAGSSNSTWQTSHTVKLSDTVALFIATKVVSIYREMYAYVVDISTGTPVVGTETLLGKVSDGTMYDNPKSWGVAAIDSSRLLLSYVSSSGSTYSLKVRVLSISGTTISLGTEYTYATTTATDWTGIGGDTVACIGTDKMLITTYYSSAARYYVVNTSGSTVSSVGTAATSATGIPSKIYAIGTDTVLEDYVVGNSHYLRVIGVSGTTPTLNTGTLIYTPTNPESVSLLYVKSEWIMVAPSNIYKINISGTSVTATAFIQGNPISTSIFFSSVADVVFYSNDTPANQSAAMVTIYSLNTNTTHVFNMKSTRFTMGNATATGMRPLPMTNNRVLCVRYTGSASGYRLQCKIASNGY